MLVSDLIASAMKLIGVLAAGETPNTDESADVFARLNELLDAWSSEPEGLLTVAQRSVSLAASNGSYALSPRPVLIRSGAIVTSEGLRIPLDILGSTEWNALLERNATARVPRKVFCDYAYPTATLYVSPIPSVVSTAELECWNALSGFSSSADSISWPPGYLKAVRYSLAIAIAPEFGAQIDPIVATEAVNSKAALRALNAQYLSGKPIEGPPPQVVPAAAPAR